MPNISVHSMHSQPDKVKGRNSKFGFKSCWTRTNDLKVTLMQVKLMKLHSAYLKLRGHAIKIADTNLKCLPF